jgi:hypothetical protein
VEVGPASVGEGSTAGAAAVGGIGDGYGSVQVGLGPSGGIGVALARGVSVRVGVRLAAGEPVGVAVARVGVDERVGVGERLPVGLGEEVGDKETVGEGVWVSCCNGAAMGEWASGWKIHGAADIVVREPNASSAPKAWVSLTGRCLDDRFAR